MGGRASEPRNYSPENVHVPVPKQSRVQKADSRKEPTSSEANDGEPKRDRRGRRRSALEEDGSVTCETLAFPVANR